MGFDSIFSSRKALMFGIFASTASCHYQHPSTLRPRSSANTTFPYQNASLCVDARLDDLISRMTVEEKAGQLFHTQIYLGPNGTFDEGSRGNGTTTMVTEKFMSHYNLASDVTNVTQTAEWQNALQELALSTRLGIPITLSSDPRHAFTENIGTGFAANAFSQWPESLGLAAMRSAEAVQKFAEVAREEYA